MKISNNEITIQRGEAFSIDRTVVNRDGSPYILSKELINPHILITVSSSKYNEANRYVLNSYLPLSDFPRFLFVNPINLEDVGKSDFSTDLKLTLSDKKLVFLTAKFNGELVGFQPDDALFYLSDANGNKTYKRWVPESMTAGSSGSWEDYSFRFVKFFDSNTTSQWLSQTYYYSISIVSGEHVLDGVYDNLIPLLPPTKLSVVSNLRGRM